MLFSTFSMSNIKKNTNNMRNLKYFIDFVFLILLK